MSYPNVLNYTKTNSLNIDDVRETCQEEQDILKNDILKSIKNSFNSGISQVVEFLTQNITRAMGDFWFSVDGTIPAGGLPHLGHIVSRDLYSDFYIWVEGNKIILSDEEWLAYAESHGGCCPYYSSGDGSTTFRTPSYPDTFLKIVNDMNKSSLYEEEGLPNIKGYSSHTWAENNYYGCTAPYSFEPTTITGVGCFGAGTGYRQIFNASLSNAIYGSSDHVTPKNVSMLIGVYAVGAIVPVGVTDAEKIMNDITRIDYLMNTKVDNSKPHIVDTYTSGTSWYRVYSDGWIEQGGEITGGVYSSPTTITFYKPFKDTNYTINSVVVTSETGNWTRTVYLGNKNNSTIKVVTGYNGSGGSNLIVSWYACGY